MPRVLCRAIVRRWGPTTRPTQASSYLTGCLEILRIRDRFLEARGASLTDVDDMRDFHDALTGAGTLPIALAERAVMATA